LEETAVHYYLHNLLAMQPCSPHGSAIDDALSLMFRPALRRRIDHYTDLLPKRIDAALIALNNEVKLVDLDHPPDERLSILANPASLRL